LILSHFPAGAEELQFRFLEKIKPWPEEKSYGSKLANFSHGRRYCEGMLEHCRFYSISFWKKPPLQGAQSSRFYFRQPHIPLPGVPGIWVATKRVKLQCRKGDSIMLNWSITFLVIGLIAALLGFTGVAGAATQIAWILFVVFLVLFLISLFMGRGRTSL
jgi:uncharacterized membrane protein YtjA (UPF0391 family)